MSELKRLIAKGEGISLDFKFCIDDKKKIARTLVAFANSKGGKLLIGVKDNGKIKGVDPEEEYYMIEAAAELHCNPPVKFESHIWEEGHHLVLEIKIPKSEIRHKAEDEDGSWRHYIRVEDHTLIANKIVLRIWNLIKHGQERPSEFNEEMENVLSIIRENQPVRISKVYKNVDIKMKEVDSLIAQLVYWNIIDMNIEELGTTYSISKE